MRLRCAMTPSRVTPPAEVEGGADEVGTEEAGGVDFSVRGRFGQSWASLCLTLATSVAHITVK